MQVLTLHKWNTQGLEPELASLAREASSTVTGLRGKGEVRMSVVDCNLLQ